MRFSNKNKRAVILINLNQIKKKKRILTSAIFADVGFGTQTFFRRIADGISWTIVVEGASHERHAFGFSVGFRSRSFRAATFMRTRDIDAKGTRATDARTLTFIDIYINAA